MTGDPSISRFLLDNNSDASHDRAFGPYVSAVKFDSKLGNWFFS